MVKSKEIVDNNWKGLFTQFDNNNLSVLIKIEPEKGWIMNDVNPSYYLEGDYAYYYTIARLTKKDKCILIITHVEGQYFYTNFKKSRKKVLVSILFSPTSYLEFRYGQLTI